MFKIFLHFLKKYKPNKYLDSQIPETLITVTIDRVTDWDNLPDTRDVKFWRTHFNPNLSAEAISKSKNQFQEEMTRQRKENPESDIRYVDNFKQFG
jgi:hypothetical protein